MDGPPLTVGFTGTRHGSTVAQLARLVRLLTAVEVAEVHHGDCLGADRDVDQVAVSLGIRRVAHPPDNPRMRAYCDAEEVRPEEPYKVRNRAIVRATCPLIGVPFESQERQHGGTWGTVGYARLLRRPVVVVRPDGSCWFDFGAERFFGLDSLLDAVGD